MNNKPAKKLTLKKSTVTLLSEKELNKVQGGSLISIIYATGGCVSLGCATDFTRPRTIVIHP
jgi:bacteriocin-like protein